jgi:uncharacterized Zn-finger protein
MRRAKLPSLSHHELVVGKHKSSGRPKTVTFTAKSGEKRNGVAKHLVPTETSRDLYLAAANARNPKGAQEFLKRYPFFTIYDDALRGPRHATPQDIEHFSKIARAILGNMERRGSIRKEAAAYKTKYTPAPLPLVDDDVEFINRELAHCSPMITASPYTSHEPTQFETNDFKRGIQDIEDRFDKQRERLNHFVVGDKKRVAAARSELARMERGKEGAIREAMDEYSHPHIFMGGGPRRSGGSFLHIEMRCETGMAACCYYVAQDLANEEEVRICPQCSRLFIAETKKQTYCKDTDCAKMVARVKSRRSYAKTKHRKS